MWGHFLMLIAHVPLIKFHKFTTESEAILDHLLVTGQDSNFREKSTFPSKTFRKIYPSKPLRTFPHYRTIFLAGKLKYIKLELILSRWL